MPARGFWAAGLTAAVVAWSAAGQPVRARGGLVGPPAGLVQDAPAPDRTVLRSRYITINFDALPDATRPSMSREPPMVIELFPDFVVSALFDRSDPAAAGSVVVGHVDGVAPSSVTLAYNDGLMAGSIALPGRTFSIRPAPADVRAANPQPGGALHVVAEIDQSAFPREPQPIEVTPPPGFREPDRRPTDSADTIDLMVVFTQTAMTGAGGATAMNNLINLGLSETNTSYANSKIAQRLRLVYSGQVSYTESNAFGTNLSDLRLGVGALSVVAGLRDTNRADLVMLLVRPQSPDACGIAYIQSSISASFSTFGFSVVDASCVSPSYTFAHELGHNMGARHDWYVDSGTTPFTYAHGYVNPSTGQRWRTIMSYNDLCTDQGFNCSRLLYWANPSITYLASCTSSSFDCSKLQYWYFPGVPMGVPGGTDATCRANSTSSPSCDADDARTLNATALTVANFRAAASPAVRR